MELDYRAVLGVKSSFGRTSIEEFDQALYDWLRGKGLDADRLTLGVTEFNASTVGTLAAISQKDGSTIKRFRLTEVRKQSSEVTETWHSEVLLHARATGDGEVLVHISDPRPNLPSRRPGPTGVPGIVRLLAKTAKVSDGLMELFDGPTILDRNDEDLVHDMIVDEQRRGLLILAATPPDASPEEFSRAVRELTFGTVGQAGVFVLTAELCGLLDGHTAYLTLPRGGMRMIPPGLDPAIRASVNNSYFVTAERIAERGLSRVGRHWTWLVREHANSQPWPRQLQRVMRTITEHERDYLLADLEKFIQDRERIRTGASQPAEGIAETSPAAETKDLVNSAPHSSSLESTPLETEVHLERALQDALVKALPNADILNRILVIGGCATVSESLDFALLLAGDYDQLESRASALASELSTDMRHDKDLESYLALENQVLEAQVAIEELEGRLDREVRGAQWLRSQLIELKRADIAWNHPEFLELAQDFDAILDVIKQLELVEFTGDPEQTLDLNDMRGSQAAAKKTHRALLALNDYARARKYGDWSSGSFVEYLDDAPAGYATISRKIVAPKESDSVGNNPEFRRFRNLRMPDGSIQFMEAHIKLSQEAMTAPRLHFYDDTMKSGVVVVGYIGAHLPNTRT